MVRTNDVLPVCFWFFVPIHRNPVAAEEQNQLPPNAGEKKEGLESFWAE